jgi:hypothetical protein
MQQYSYHAFFMQISRFAAVIAAAVLLGSSAACSKNDEPRLLRRCRSPRTARRYRSAVPLELTYRFEVAPGASFDGDYRVFVHVNRDDGTTIWNDDHELPVRAGHFDVETRDR